MFKALVQTLDFKEYHERKGCSEPRPEAHIRSSGWYYGYLKSFLARSLKTVGGSHPPTESDPAESSLTAETATSATGTVSEPNTAVTPVASLPKIFVVQKLHVSPSMHVDPIIQAIWTQRIKARLSAELQVNITRGTCLQEFMMASRRSNKLKPTLIVTCGDPATKREVEKIFKSQYWLQEILKANNIMFVALVAETSLSAAPWPDSAIVTDLIQYYAVLLPSGALTACGSNLKVVSNEYDKQSHCTLGGLLMVDGEIMGLTAGHPFTTVGCSASEYGHLDMARNSEIAKSEESSTTSSDPFIFNEDDDDDLDKESIASSVSLPEVSHDVLSLHDDTACGQREPVLGPPLLMGRHPSQEIILSKSIIRPDDAVNDLSHHHDWALLKNLPRNVVSLPNLSTNNDRHPQTPIEKNISVIAGGEVKIMIPGAGLLPGYLHPCPARMNVDKVVLDVHLITLERVLPLGVSGAWVSLENKLCGYVVAVRQDYPWAYMVAIEPVLDDIKRMRDTDDIRLPTVLEVQQSASSRIDYMPRWVLKNSIPVRDMTGTRVHDQSYKSPSYRTHGILFPAWQFLEKVMIRVGYRRSK